MCPHWGSLLGVNAGVGAAKKPGNEREMSGDSAEASPLPSAPDRGKAGSSSGLLRDPERLLGARTASNPATKSRQ